MSTRLSLFLLCGLLLCLSLLAGCAALPDAATPSPFPTFDLRELPPPVGIEPPTVRAYLSEVAAYTDPAFIAVAPRFSVERLNNILATLETVTAPPEMLPAHETLLKGYRSIAEGRRIQVGNVGDGQQQAEARSLLDFGQLLLQEHNQIVVAYLEALATTPVP